MKTTTIFLSIILFIFPVSAEKLAEFREVLNPIALYIDNQHIFFREQFSVHIYNRATYEYIGKFGNHGEGPGEFRLFMGVTFMPNKIILQDNKKMCIFSTTGKMIAEMIKSTKFSTILPLANTYLEIIETNLPKKKPETFFNILDSNMKNPVKIYNSIPIHIEADDETKQKRDILPFPHCLNYQVSNEKIIIGDSSKGFCFFIFNFNGKLINKVVLNQSPIRIDNATKAKLTNPSNHSPLFRKSINLLKQEYYPAFRSFIVKNDVIYAITDERIDNQYTVVLLHTDGKKLRKTRIPSQPIIYDFYDNIFFYLMENEKNDTIELHAEVLTD